MYRCFERYKTEVFGFAILGDRSPGYRPKAYTRQLGNSRLHYEFECAKLLDYKVEELEASDNPAALILLFTEQGIAKGLELGRQEGIEKGKELGRQEGKELGRQEGKELGRQEGKALGAERVLTSLLVRRFGDLPSWAYARLKDADADILEQWSLRVLDAGRLEDVFA